MNEIKQKLTLYYESIIKNVTEKAKANLLTYLADVEQRMFYRVIEFIGATPQGEVLRVPETEIRGDAECAFRRYTSKGARFIGYFFNEAKQERQYLFYVPLSAPTTHTEWLKAFKEFEAIREKLAKGNTATASKAPSVNVKPSLKPAGS